MKSLFVVAIATVSLSSFYLTSCNSAANKGNAKENTTTTQYDTIVGEPFQPENILAVADLEEKLKGNESLELVIEGTVQSCCQKKGCWMRIDKGNGEAMMVTFKDYGFFVPFESAGKTAIMKGVAYYDTISVEMLKHYAEDAGKSEAEIEAITEPELAVSFEASGVMLK
jgi:hypothetical protein